MILIGRNASPFVRRTAASMNLLGIAFTQNPIGAADHPEEVRRANPLMRVPALVWDDGEVMLDSVAILDALDEQAGPDRALMPAAGAARRRASSILALATGSMEKVVAAYYERRRPAPYAWAEQEAKLAGQVEAGFRALDVIAATNLWLCGERLTQPDVTTTCAMDFADRVLPDFDTHRFVALSALRDRANLIPEIASTFWKA